MVLTELLQNALQHGVGAQQGKIEVIVTRKPDRLAVVVADTGDGFPDDFDLESSSSLGLQIVRTLVVGELGGRLEISPGRAGGTEVLVDLPVPVVAAGNGAPAGPPPGEGRPGGRLPSEEGRPVGGLASGEGRPAARRSPAEGRPAAWLSPGEGQPASRLSPQERRLPGGQGESGPATPGGPAENQ
jgi:hypothetical protein